MEIVRTIYNRLMSKMEELEQEGKRIMALREDARKDGDLSENADYQKACSDLDDLFRELDGIYGIISGGIVVDESNKFNTIGVGSKFRLRVTLETNFGELEYGNIGSYTVSEVPDGVLVDSVIVVAGDISGEYELEGYVSTKSSTVKYLMNKPAGKYITYTDDGDKLILEVTHCD